MNILVVEDDANIRRGIVDHFKNQGWQVTEAMDGQLGLDLCSAQAYDLIVLDIMLPRVNGYEICRTLRLAGKSTPIIMLTAKSSEKDVLQGFNAGATVTLTDKEAKVLSLLALNCGKVMTRENILNSVWGNTYLQSTRSVDRCIKTLRKKLDNQVIITVRQVGYMIEK